VFAGASLQGRKTMGLMSCAMKRPIAAVAAVLLFAAGAQARAAIPFTFGFYPVGPLDGITDVPGVMVSHLTKVEGDAVRTGATAVLPNGNPWIHKVAAYALAFNGNGEMTGAHWINEAGYLEEPVVLTDTMDVGRADDGVVSWDVEHHPQMGRSDDVPLPVVMECDDGFLNDIAARAVTAADVKQMLDAARPGQFARGSVGAGTGMTAFSFKGGIGSASRVLPKDLGGYTVGVLVNDNTSGGNTRRNLTIDGVHVGEAMQHEYRPMVPKHTALRGRNAYGSIDIVIATNAPLDSRQLHAVALRAGMGMARTGLYSSVGSGDLFVAFSTAEVFEQTSGFTIETPQARIVEDEDTLNGLYLATVEATEEAIYNALFDNKTMIGRNGATVYALPADRVMQMLRSAGVK
jgi:D-aminopeptidase